MALSRPESAVPVSTEDVLVAFSIKPRYEPGQPVHCHYEVLSDYTVQSRDYVAMYPAENFQPSVLTTYRTWQWADVNTKEGQKTTIFPARHLPHSSSVWFLFAYISWSQGVIGLSEQFQILYFSGDPVSLVSDTTEKSSFVILEKTVGNGNISSSGYLEDVCKPAESTDVLVLLEDRTQVKELFKSRTDESAPVAPIPSHGSGIVENNPEIEQSENGSFEANVEKQEISCSNNEAVGCVGNKLDSQSSTQICDQLPNVKTDQDKEIECLKSENSYLLSQVHLAKEATEIWKSAAEKCAKEIAISRGRVQELEKDLEDLNVGLVDGNEKAVAPHKQDEAQVMAALVQENEILRQSIGSLQIQLHQSETALFQTKEKLRLCKGKRRDLEQALIRERLSYEETLRTLASKEVRPHACLNGDLDPKSEGHPTTEETVNQKSDDNLANCVPVSQRSSSALVRLGIQDEQETGHVLEQVNKTSRSNVRCPVCSTSSSIFPDEAAFSSHVNGHFPD